MRSTLEYFQIEFVNVDVHNILHRLYNWRDINILVSL